MNKKIIFLFASLLLCLTMVSAQEVKKSDLHKRAEAVDPKENIATARSLYIHAFNDYYNHGQMRQGIECAVKAASLYYSRENYYKEAFDLLRRADDAINTSTKESQAEKAAMHYLVTKERLQMYIKLRKSDSAKDQLNIMEAQANQTNDESIKDDCEKFDLSVPMGVSYQFKVPVVIDLRYNLGVSKVFKGSSDEKSKNNVVQLTVGYKFAL